MPRTATIGPAIFEQVNKLVADGKSRTEAFTQIARERTAVRGPRGAATSTASRGSRVRAVTRAPP